MQPEFGQPTTVGTDQLVDLFTGNFQYSIPLFEIGGYPMQLSYSSDHNMEEEASWVGFGWTLNPGAIARQVRGLPDDFKGDVVQHVSSVRDNVTTSISPGMDIEIFGTFGVGTALNFNSNNYAGFSFTQDYAPSINMVRLLKGGFTQDPGETKKDEPLPTWPWKQQASQATAMLSANFTSRAGLQSLSWYSNLAKQPALMRGALSYNMGGVTYTPTSNLPQRLQARSFWVKVGGVPTWPVDVSGTYRAHRLTQSLATNRLDEPAYGYLYLDGAANQPKAIVDYNVEQGGLLTADATRLPVPYGTPDAYIVTGSGLSGQIEVVRDHTLPFRPASTTSETVSVGVGAELSAGDGVSLGVNPNASTLTSHKGGWDDDEDIIHRVIQNNTRDSPEAQLRFVSSPTVHSNKRVYEAYDQADPVYAGIHATVDGVVTNSINSIGDRGQGYRSGIRSGTLGATLAVPSQGNVVSYLTAGEARFAAMDRALTLYKPLEPTSNYYSLATAVENYDRASQEDNRRDHHISEITVLSTAGRRFIYGLPVYNHIKREVSFNATKISHTAGKQGTANYGLVNYEMNKALVSIENTSGTDHLYDEVSTAPHPVAHLLTGVLSSDYMDVSDDGLTPDDLGNYVKIGYASIASADGTPKKVGYRTPIGAYTAVLNRGNLADDGSDRLGRQVLRDQGDDKATFSYGAKEVYYVHHMDSKTHRAVFFTSNRTDAQPVDRDGKVVSDLALQKLDQIKLFTLAELKRADEDDRSPVPIKTVHFEYATDGSNQQISSELPNAVAGKLTLRRVYFTYADNQRGAANPYTFTYKTDFGTRADGSLDKANYVPFMMDRWGTRKPVSDQSSLEPLLYPYASQDPVTAEKYCDVNNLIAIDLPSGGRIAVEYEPDDYAYVQDYRAGKMYTLAAVSKSKQTSLPKPTGESDISHRTLYTPDGGLGEANLYAYVRLDHLPDEYKAEEWKSEKIKNYFLDQIDLLYFSALVDLQKEPLKSERITGYAAFDRESADVFRDGGDQKLYLVLKLEGLTKKNVETDRERSIHPITYAALDKIQYELPKLLYDDMDILLAPAALIPKIRELAPSMQNFYKWRLNRNIANAHTFQPEGSYVRLSDPLYRKYGGGSRVKAVTLSDNWVLGADYGETTMDYVKVYDYTVHDKAIGRRISSGVAANEPMNGKEEMLYVNVGKHHHPKFLTANPVTYMENPAGLAFFPAPSVGYSSVTTRTLVNDQYGQSKPGSTVSEFYTAKDFPVRVSLTDIDRAAFKTPTVNLFLASLYLSRLGLSQGFTIETNDMHGRPKATYERGADGYDISSTVYSYRTANGADGSYLNNLVEVVKADPSGTAGGIEVSDEYLGLRATVWVEMMADRTTSTGGGFQVNADLAFPFRIALPSYPTVNRASSSLHTVAITKLIHQTGILDKVTVTNNGSSLETTNLQFDALTGSPTLTSTQNEYGQPIYDLTAMAYWMKDHGGMGPAYSSHPLRIENTSIEQGVIQKTFFMQNTQLTEGDELVAYSEELNATNAEVRQRAFVVKYQDQLLLIDEYGKLVDTPDGANTTIVLTRSGRRNLLTSPAERTSAMVPPRPEAPYYAPYQDQNASSVLSSTATQYTDTWGNLCVPIEPPPVVDDCDKCTDCEQCPECLHCPPCDEPPCGCTENAVSETEIWKTPGWPWVDNTNTANSWDQCPAVQVQNWYSIRQRLKSDCSACDELFYHYASINILSCIDQYATRDLVDGRLVINPLPGKADAISNCEYITTEGQYTRLFFGEPVRLHQIASYQSNPIVDNKEGDPCYYSRYGTDGGFVLATPPPLASDHPTVVLSSEEPATCSLWNPDSGSNPYLSGQRGNWRPKSSYLPNQTVRNYTNVERNSKAGNVDNDETQPLLYQDGGLGKYAPYFFPNTVTGQSANHTEISRVTRYDEHGHELETEDALGIPSGAQYGFYQSLPVAVAQNARHADIGFDSFEDYYYDREGDNSRWLRHFGMLGRQVDQSQTARLVEGIAHTGKHALRVTAGSREALSVTYDALLCDTVVTACPDEQDCSSCLSGFRPKRKGRYLFSGWVANATSLDFGQRPEADGQVIITATAEFADNTTQVIASEVPSGPVIDGWQQLHLDFTLPAQATQLTLIVSSPSGTSAEVPLYIDDVRIQPYAAEMTSYVYDPTTLRLMAQLDDRGYAVYYEYDDEGRLIRQKRETERGIMTITEQHTNLATSRPKP